MYFEYESGILRAPGARGLFTAAIVMNASNAKRPQGGTSYIQHTIDLALAATMGIESKIALASCFASKAADFARAAAIFSNKTLEIIAVPVKKQRLITELFKTNKTRSSMIALGILCGLTGLFTNEIQAMPPKGDKTA